MLFVPLCFVGCGQKEESLNSYEIQAVYDTENGHGLFCKQKVGYYNRSDNCLKEIDFHLYPNAFREGAKAKVVSSANESKAYPNGKSYGKVEIRGVTITDLVSGYSVGGVDENILIVNLSKDLYPDEFVEIEMEYYVTLPNINHRFGYGANTINFGNFYPIACVYENGKGFVQDLYHSNGDPFYSESANYKVEITYPSNMTLASTGDIKNESKDEKLGKTTVITANNVRDFAFVLSDKFSVKSQSVDGIMVNYFYYSDSDPDASLLVAVKAMKTFNNLFGKYPYASINVAEANFVHGGMEYPNLVLISDDIASHQDYEYVIVHELAHQWWYGVVGNNEYINGWQDEGLTEYSTALFYEHNKEYGLELESIMKNINKNYKLFVDVYTSVNGQLDTSMNRRLDEYSTEPEYVNCTYTKGAIMFDTLRQTVGDNKFYKALKTYYKTFMYKTPTAVEFIDCMSRATGYRLDAFFESWLNGSAAIL